ncbi:MAG: hypothetical protein RLZ44_1096, partial [Pseudomonadota bacterium]
MLALLLGGCTATRPNWPAAAPADAQDEPRRLAVLRQADRLIGTPYRYGGTDPRGFDCSGLVQFVHESVGVPVP